MHYITPIPTLSSQIGPMRVLDLLGAAQCGILLMQELLDWKQGLAVFLGILAKKCLVFSLEAIKSYFDQFTR